MRFALSFTKIAVGAKHALRATPGSRWPASRRAWDDPGRPVPTDPLADWRNGTASASIPPTHHRYPNGVGTEDANGVGDGTGRDGVRAT